jgi:hypothetical protein
LPNLGGQTKSGVDAAPAPLGQDRSPIRVEKAAAAIRSPAVQLGLQEVFGLRREESIKIRPGWAN